MRVAILTLAIALFVVSGSPLLAQRDFLPATATIRGENIWLRVDPAEDTVVLAYLQRGDPIRVTDNAVPADGDAFYPIEVVETGETGWVRDLAVDPRSFTPVETLPEVVIDEPPPEEELAPREARPPRTRTPREKTEAETVVVDEPPPDEEPARPRRQNNQVATEDRGETNGLSVSGVGLDVSDPFALEAGRYRVTATVNVTADYDGFTCQLRGPGNFDELVIAQFIEAPQVWTGEAIVETQAAGDYFVEVDTESEWTIEFVPY